MTSLSGNSNELRWPDGRGDVARRWKGCMTDLLKYVGVRARRLSQALPVRWVISGQCQFTRTACSVRGSTSLPARRAMGGHGWSAYVESTRYVQEGRSVNSVELHPWPARYVPPTTIPNKCDCANMGGRRYVARISVPTRPDQ